MTQCGHDKGGAGHCDTLYVVREDKGRELWEPENEEAAPVRRG